VLCSGVLPCVEMGSVQSSRQGAVKQIDGLLNGLGELPQNQVFTLAGKQLTVAAVSAELRAFLDLLGAVDKARALLGSCVAAARKGYPPLRQRVRDLRAYIQATYGASNPMLSRFGMRYRSRKKPRPNIAATAIEKRKATREARHTMGPKQKAKVRGKAAPAKPTTPAK
jgi:hypothetical protein